ncbi:MAG: response regulator, partial [bacterium]
NINFYEAENGLQALEVYKNSKIDLILLDINMPVMNGIQFLEAIYENKKVKNIKVPIIIISGLLSDDVMNKNRDRGVVNYIKKPFKVSILRETIKKYL